jgi:nitrate reductase (cytochrome), electron transfer subunit
MMNKIKFIAFGMTALLVFGVGTASAEKKHHKETAEEELGIRKGSLYDEDTVKPERGEYSHTKPGESKKLGRAFENSPPLIPHDMTGMLPIAATNNMCVGCHMPEAAKGIGATPMPKSHLFDIDTGKDLRGKLDGKRYFCMECHVPQVNIPEPIKNTFKGDFRTKKSKTSSDLINSLNEGVQTE